MVHQPSILAQPNHRRNPGARGANDYATRIAGIQRTVLQTLSKLSAGRSRPRPLHRLRTDLRRWQAYLDLIGEGTEAQRIGRNISRLSRLRSWHVMRAYAESIDAPKSDLKAINKRLRKARRRIKRNAVYAKLYRAAERSFSKATPITQEDLAALLARARKRHAKDLGVLIDRTRRNPRRKLLHSIRLRIKSLRYQEELAGGRTDLIGPLKTIQSVLGGYEDCSEFCKLAKKLGLKSVQRMLTDREAAEEAAYWNVQNLVPIVDALDQDGGSAHRKLERANLTAV